MWCGSVLWRRDGAGPGRPRVPATGPRSHGPRLRVAPRRGADRARLVHVPGALLAPVPPRLRGDAVLLSHDPPHRTGQGAAAPRGHVRHGRLYGSGMYVARLVQRPVHRAGGADADLVPRWRPHRAGDRTDVRGERSDAPACRGRTWISTMDAFWQAV